MEDRRDLAGAHPRWRGEHVILLAIQLRLQGSSPLARGARLKLTLTRPNVGLIPAGAGSTVNRLVKH